MDSDPLPMLEKSDALQRHEVHGNTQETGFDFRHLPSGAKRIKSMDGKAQKTTITQSLPTAQKLRCAQGAVSSLRKFCLRGPFTVSTTARQRSFQRVVPRRGWP